MSRDELVETFAGFPVRLAAVATARAAESRLVPDGGWGPSETVRHLIAVEDGVWRSRLARVAAEDDPHWTWTEPGLAPGFDEASLQEILAAFAASRAATVATIRALDDAGWARFRHPCDLWPTGRRRPARDRQRSRLGPPRGRRSLGQG